jgi:hypothetical protein
MSRWTGLVCPKLDADQLRALSARYDGIKFNRVEVTSYLWVEDSRFSDVNDYAHFGVSGPVDALLRHRFLIPEWTALPRCGVRSHCTKGFGNGHVHRTRTGLRLEYARYDDWLDKLAAALMTPALERFRRPPATSP